MIRLLVVFVFISAAAAFAAAYAPGSQATVAGLTQGDVDCAGGVRATDGLRILLHGANVNSLGAQGGCPTIGQSTVGGFPWGDTNCDGAVDADDLAPVLRGAAGLPLEEFPGCVPVGDAIEQSATPTPTPSGSPSATPFVCDAIGWTVVLGSATWDCSAGEPDRVELHVDDGDHVMLRDESFTDTHMESDVMTLNREAGLVIRAQDGQNYYVAVIVPEGTPFPSGVQFYRVVGGAYAALAVVPFTNPVSVGDVINFEVDMVGTNAIVKVNGETLINVNDATFSSGRVGLRAYADPNAPCDTTWDNISFNEIP